MVALILSALLLACPHPKQTSHRSHTEVIRVAQTPPQAPCPPVYCEHRSYAPWIIAAAGITTAFVIANNHGHDRTVYVGIPLRCCK